MYSVPAGTCIDVDSDRRTLTVSRYFRPWLNGNETSTLEQSAEALGSALHRWFGRPARQFASHRVLICLSGGVDSGLIAAFARRYFASVTAYTFAFSPDGNAGQLSEDAESAERLAGALGIPWRLVRAGPDDVVGALRPAILNGQDWRDFNVHCAMVNELLARAMINDWTESGSSQPVIVLTGDLMNELVADYSPVRYKGHDYYALPRLSRDQLRLALVRGLDAGDREVGVFARHGLRVVQPYGLVSDSILGIPSRLLCAYDAKQRLARSAAAALLPEWLLTRAKVRAQIGNRTGENSMLALLVDRGYDAHWLRQTFCSSLGASDGAFPGDFIRAGAYRSLNAFPKRECANDYLTH
jgi:asparagine synthetase B (glutamine-hydrolysing)